MNIRELTEEAEARNLSPFAVLSKNTRGREEALEPCDIRTAFQRDRDRIIHAKSFRRLMHKTQVFLAPEGDHYRTRLTHTLEVSQIARTIARALRLNEDLTEAIALGHDLGHTPFGHTGEAVLDEICTGGFKHYEQSLRVVEELEGGKGLNLTWEVRDGIVNHAGKHEASTLEGQIIKYADRIAYINHDIDDAIRGGVIAPTDIPLSCRKTLGETHSDRLQTLISDVIDNSREKPQIFMSQEIYDAMMELRRYMFDNVYTSSVAKAEEHKAKGIIKTMFETFLHNPNQLREAGLGDVCLSSEREICDYIAGMTDNYAIYVFNSLFIPKGWQVRR
ncbi:MAG: deoxyguanosinetriphosphate triphosphohydrolase [Ruminococcaceae bacterium]|nr:deoxyguanosinetriphosphate triphosphohydrolase [Oscillospiraceae bacterium]